MKNLIQKIRANFFRGIFELIIIFLGISISLFIDDWRTERAEDEMALQYMRSMYSDVSEDLEKLEWQSRDRFAKMRDARVILDAMHFPDSVQITEADFRNRFGYVTRLTTFVSSDNTYNDLNSTGNIRLIKDVALKSGIYEYYGLVEEFNELEKINNGASADLSVDVISNEFSVRSVYRFGSLYDGAEELQKFDMSLFRNPESKQYSRLEDVLLYRHIFIGMEIRKAQELWEPAVALRERLCALTNIPTLDQIVEKWKSNKNKSAIEVHTEFKTKFPELKLAPAEVNDFAYSALTGGEIDMAIEFFELGVHLYPEQSNSYDSLGEAYFENGDLERARKNYEKALELDPDSETAPVMLRKIQYLEDEAANDYDHQP